MKGILLAGGSGTRLGPVTKVISKQLLPVYDKPMIYYPLSVLMASGLREIALVSSPNQIEAFKNLLLDGSQWGIKITYYIQNSPNGLPDVFNIIEDDFLKNGTVLMLGDNLFYGSKIGKKISELYSSDGASIFGYLVNDISELGSFTVNENNTIEKLVEKQGVGSGYAIPGLYKFDSQVKKLVRNLKYSQRGELEITDLINIYKDQNLLSYQIIDRGTAWIDTGTVENLAQASELVRVIQSAQGMLIGSPDEVAFRNGWISKNELIAIADTYGSSPYGKSLLDVISTP
jgi:glucose-1-phosphate thymidylyltransferase